MKWEWTMDKEVHTICQREPGCSCFLQKLTAYVTIL